MPNTDNTVPYVERASAPRIDRLTVRIVEGPDQGKTAEVIGNALSVGTASDNALPLTDETVSRYHLDLEPHPQGVLVRDNGSTNGTVANNMLVERAVVQPGTIIRLGRTRLEVGKLTGDEVQLFPSNRLCGVIGASHGMRRMMAQIDKVSRSDVAVTVLGESGTGKELIASALHELSARSTRPFETVDCGALTPGLVASELFGHERGAFTGADRQHIGALERAHGGTLMLDEIGELPLDLQPVLLGALERRRIKRVGGKADIPIDVRVVAATHRDLRADVNAGKFRLDLYYRIAVVVLRVPALREHPGDIPLLVEHFLKDIGASQRANDLFPEQAMLALQSQNWPGNVRELRNFVEATLALGMPPQHAEHTTPSMMPPPGGLALSAFLDRKYKDARDGLLREFERQFLEHWLRKAGNNVARAARLCEMDRSHLFQMLRRHGLR
jgi:DNA-binding NtrC family response regulator